MIKKLIKIGNSLGITFSSVFIKTAKLKTGDLVEIQENEIVPTKKMKKTSPHLEGVTPEFLKLVDETIEEYKPALRALAKK